MSIYQKIDESNINRRWLLLLLVLFLVLIGTGAGTIIFSPPGSPPSNNETTPTPTETPTGTSTPTDTLAGGTPEATESPAQTPSVSTPTPSQPDETPDGPSDIDPDDGSSNDGGDDPPVSSGLELGNGQQLLNEANLVPGESGQGTLTLRNTENEDGNLTITTIDITDEENGIVGPEESVDPNPEKGELSSHLKVRISIRGADANKEYLLGTDGGYVTLKNLREETPSVEYELASGEEVTLVAHWKLPPSTGNEVQSDRIAVDLGLHLESLDS